MQILEGKNIKNVGMTFRRNGQNIKNALTEVARIGQCVMETPATKVPDTGHRGRVIPCSRDCICVAKIRR